MSSDNNDNLRLPDLILKIIYIVFIIVVFFVITNYLKKLIEKGKKDDSDTTATPAPTPAPTTTDTTATPAPTTTAPTTTATPAPTTTDTTATMTTMPIDESMEDQTINATPEEIVSELESSSEINTTNVEEMVENDMTTIQNDMTTIQEETMKIPTTKNIYQKYEDINLPSSLKKETGGYIPSHYVCFRNKSNNIDYIKKRQKCMACQVDNRLNKNSNYDNTMTNISVTCPYNNENEPGVFSREDCLSRCAQINDLSD